MITIGIDPGITGAIAALSPSGLVWVIDMPVRTKPGSGKIRNEVDPRSLQASLRKLVPEGVPGVVVMESLNAFMGSGEQRQGSMASQASLAATKAVICTVCELTGLDIRFVSPRIWQRFFGIANRESESTKKQSLRIARQLYGREFCPLEKHDGRADALLIARWALRHLVESTLDLPVLARVADPLDI